MAFVSARFFLFVIISILVYDIVPQKFRWYALLLSSIIFYAYTSKIALLVAVIISVFSYCMAIIIEASDDKRKKKKILIAVSVIVLISILGAYKILGNIESLAGKFIFPLGISYFTLSIIGYLLDVYWKKEEAEKNFGHFLTFVLYFPKVVQGPISRHKFLQKQLIAGNSIKYENVCFGLQLMLWGYFKKIVIADRFSILTSRIYADLDVYCNRGGLLIIAMLASAIQLYMDFSGYTDIALGLSQVYGIELEKNFNRPFFSQSASEFWQRWHMTLSGWFKDYLFLPVSRSGFVKKISKKMGNRYGAIARKKTMMVIATSVVWLATGLWHGTGINYIVWGIYWGFIIISSEILESFFSRICNVLHINTLAPTWKLFRIFRTFCIFMVGKMISAQNNLYDVKIILLGVLKNVHPTDFLDIDAMGISILDICVLLMGISTVFVVGLFQECGFHIREEIAKWNALPRWFFYSICFTTVIFLGIYGSEYDTSTFAYQFF